MASPAALPAGAASGPLINQAIIGFVTEDNPNPALGEMPDANYLVIGAHYLRVMGIPLLAGGYRERGIDAQGQWPGSARFGHWPARERAPNQNKYFSPNWIWRMAVDVDVTTPKF